MHLSSETSIEDALEKRRKLRATLPERIADHELLRPIASGSYGEVWLGRNGVTGAFRAIKIIWIDAFETRKPYEREFEAIGRFEPVSRTHSGLIVVLQTGRLDNGFYYIMELADDLRTGTTIEAETYEPATLAALQTAKGSPEEAIRIGIALCGSLAALHDAGLIHRDVKAANVIFVGGVPKLADIGLIAEFSESNSLVGTRGFIAPEGPTTAKSDIFSLGKLLYEVATGKDRLDFPDLPDGTSNKETLLLELNQVLVKACSPDPRQRHASVRAVRDELESLDRGRSIRRVRQLERALRWTRASFLTAVTLATALFSLLYAMQTKKTSSSLNLERKVAAALAKGEEKIGAGDYLAALNYYAQGAVLDPANQNEHQTRLWSVRLLAPRIATEWKSDSATACYAEGAKLLATIHGDLVRMTDVAANRVVKEFAGPVSQLAMDRAGTTLAIADGNQVRLINLSDNSTRTEQFEGKVTQISVSDAHSLAVVTQEGKAHFFSGHRKPQRIGTNIFDSILSPSGKYLSLLNHDGEVSVLLAATMEPLPLRIKHASLPYHAEFVRDERAVITCSFDRTAICRDLLTGSTIGYPMAHDDGVLWAAESPDGKLIATASLDRTARIWNAADLSPSRLNHILYHEQPITWAKFLDPNSLLAHSEDGITRLWRFAPGTNAFRQVSFTMAPPDKRRLQEPGLELFAVTNRVSGRVGTRDVSILLNKPVETIAVNRQKTLIAVGTRDEDRDPHSVQIFDTFGKRIGKLPHRDGITYVAFSHSGEQIVSCSEDFSARIWDLSGAPLTPPLRHKGQVRWAAFNATDNWVATASYDGTVRVWNARTGFAITPPIFINAIAEYVNFESEMELAIANSTKNYRISLDRFTGGPKSLLGSLDPTSDVTLGQPLVQ